VKSTPGQVRGYNYHTTMQNTDWFTSLHSNQELRQILQNYRREFCQTNAQVPPEWGRCRLARELEQLQQTVTI
jgi:hypothetical protein